VIFTYDLLRSGKQGQPWAVIGMEALVSRASEVFQVEHVSTSGISRAMKQLSNVRSSSY